MKSRLAVLIGALALWGGGIGYRLYGVQVAGYEHYAARATRQQRQEIDVSPPRGTIYDARGRTLAVSVTVDSACVFPPRVARPEETVEALAAVLDLEPAKIRALVDDERQFRWLERLLAPEVAAELRALDLPGVGFVGESKRFYPQGALAGPVLGFVGLDHDGLAGLEAQYEQTLAGRPIRRTVLRDGLKGQVMAPGLSLLDAEPGADLHLTLDASVQYVVERELAAAVDRHHAKSGTAVVMDPASGALLALASYPAFDPGDFAAVAAERRRNRAVQDTYEPGSTFKLVTAAAALEANVIDPVDVLDCEMGAIQLQKARIRDHHPFGLLTFRQVFAKSSNVGAIKTGLMAGGDALYDSLRAFGFGQPTGVDLPGEEIGLVRPFERWHQHADAYASIGQGLSVTALQLTRAFAAVANGGRLVTPRVVAATGAERVAVSAGPAATAPVASAATLRTLVRLLEAVVEEGTGRAAAVDGYRVAGKTGTAEKAEPGKGYYEDRHVASFAGFAPSRRPAFVAVVVIDEPRGLYHGGDVAAPVFGAIARQVLPYLGVAPERPRPSPGPDGGTVAAVDRPTVASAAGGVGG